MSNSKKKLQSIGISPASLKSDISEGYKVRADCLKEKVIDLVRLHEAMQEKLKTASEKIKILILVPDKWSQMYCSENTLFELQKK